jgi:uncharacterized integral membrane protein
MNKTKLSQDVTKSTLETWNAWGGELLLLLLLLVYIQFV